MSGGIVLLLVNCCVAALFACSYFVVARWNGGDRAVMAFSAVYTIGLVTPLSELAIHWAPHPLLMITSYAGLLLSLLMMSVALALFGRRTIPWRSIAAIAAGGLALRFAIWGGKRDELLYELLYQLPFAIALLLGASVALRLRHRKLLRYGLATFLTVIAVNFLVKPVASGILRSGTTAGDYADSAYALYSQGISGILLTAAGLFILLVVTETTVRRHLRASETDPLSGLLNRRGFEQRATAMLAAAGEGCRIAMIAIDLDRFKSINDSHGHAVGDEVLRVFALILEENAPWESLIGRIGGEEFAILLRDATEEAAASLAETIRDATANHRDDGIPPFTFSAGIAVREADETLAQLMRRADLMAYRAKDGGRDRIARYPDRPLPVAAVS
ncbi:diguanylate cyclase [Sphingopyxis sp. KK2]|uniref:GGDEF domain-containing protein n=1 Tax=Sphingopyxis sp. KK2 TaxID=1855727 RepID=UPI00097E6419|nr:GGDEF domain-containing protein [Sphingopyxis sp. KK2]